MIKGVGTDIISILRVKESLEKFGDKFAERILTENELKIFGSSENESKKITYLAKRFAAKEAVSKALGTGIGSSVSFHDIEISNDSNGKPLAVLKTNIAAKIHLSLSDERDGFAIAFVVVEE